MTTRGLTLLPPIYSEEYPAASDDTVLLIGVGCSQDNKNPTYDEDARSDLSILVKKNMGRVHLFVNLVHVRWRSFGGRSWS